MFCCGSVLVSALQRLAGQATGTLSNSRLATHHIKRSTEPIQNRVPLAAMSASLTVPLYKQPKKKRSSIFVVRLLNHT